MTCFLSQSAVNGSVDTSAEALRRWIRGMQLVPADSILGIMPLPKLLKEQLIMLSVPFVISSLMRCLPSTLS
ncbi:hypothetical protein CY34DRAFT_804811, partial [Suillus luteus UH-Slu-Lm8-n1]